MESRKVKWWNTRPYKGIVSGLAVAIIAGIMRFGLDKIGVDKQNQDKFFIASTISVFIVILLSLAIKKFSKKSF